MSRARRRARLGPPYIVVGTAALLVIAAATLSAAPSPSAAAAAACSSSPESAVRTAMTAAPITAARLRIADRLGTRGQFIGRQLDVTPMSGDPVRVILPAESSVSQASNLVVYSRLVNGRSEVRAIELGTGCDYSLAASEGIARSAILDPAGAFVYVHLVGAVSRSDEGVTRYPLNGGPGTVVLPAPLPDERYGQTFGTQLSWANGGASLAVQSCGLEACRTRLLDIARGTVETIDEVPHGELVGVTATDLIAFDACSWSPCDVLAIDLDSSEARVLAADATDAEFSEAGGDTGSVQIDTADGSVEVVP